MEAKKIHGYIASVTRYNGNVPSLFLNRLLRNLLSFNAS